MRIIYFIIAITILSCSPKKHEPKSSILFPYYDKAKGGGLFPHFKYKAGYIDLSGNRVIDNVFVDAEPFTEGLGCVSVENDNNVLYGYIDSAANFIIQPQFKRARPFHNGRALVWKNESFGWGVINRKGEFITEQIYSSITTDFDNGYCVAYEHVGKRNRWFIVNYKEEIYDCFRIDTNGVTTLIETYTSSTAHGNNILVRQQNSIAMYWTTNGSRSKYGFKKIKNEEYERDLSNYDKKGVTFISPEYKHVNDFRYGYARVVFDNNEKGYIDTNGIVVLRFKEDRPY